MLYLWNYEQRVKSHLVFTVAVLTTWSAFSTLSSTNGKLFSKALLKYHVLQGIAARSPSPEVLFL